MYNKYFQSLSVVALCRTRDGLVVDNVLHCTGSRSGSSFEQHTQMVRDRDPDTEGTGR